MMKTVADLREARLQESVATSRKLLLTLLLFALAIIGAGGVQISQARSIRMEAKALDAAMPKSWEPLESFYERSGHLLAGFGDDHPRHGPQATF